MEELGHWQKEREKEASNFNFKMPRKFQQQSNKDERKEKLEFESKLLDVARTSRVTAGGKKLSFRALVVVAGKDGKIGLGLGKANDVSFAIEKATRLAKKNMFEVPLKKGTISHCVESKYSSARVFLKPSFSGKGIVAGGAVRTICEFAGIKNITGKLISRTKNKINIARATIKALQALKSQTTNYKQYQNSNDQNSKQF